MKDLRLISFLPSATEMVCALGLEEQLIGVTHECDFPPLLKEFVAAARRSKRSGGASVSASVSERRGGSRDAK